MTMSQTTAPSISKQMSACRRELLAHHIASSGSGVAMAILMEHAIQNPTAPLGFQGAFIFAAGVACLVIARYRSRQNTKDGCFLTPK
jgi:hypothetical protein